MIDVFAAPWLIIAFAAANPFTLGPTPTPGPSGPPRFSLPEIGRVRSTTPVCAVMRDLIAPSYAASMRADVRFVEVRKVFPRYVDVADDGYDRYGPRHAMLLAELDRDAQALRDEALVLNRALGDARLGRPADQQVATVKRELQQLYDSQSGRANVLWEFVTRERAALARSGTGDGNAVGAASDPTRDRARSAPLGMPPHFSGMELSDRRAMDDWAAAITIQVRASEHRMAGALLPISQSCRSTGP